MAVYENSAVQVPLASGKRIDDILSSTDGNERVTYNHWTSLDITGHRQWHLVYTAAVLFWSFHPWFLTFVVLPGSLLGSHVDSPGLSAGRAIAAISEQCRG